MNAKSGIDPGAPTILHPKTDDFANWCLKIKSIDPEANK
jgi:hypothetical protein